MRAFVQETFTTDMEDEPVTPHSFGHVHASFLHGTELLSIQRKNLVQEKIAQESISDVQVC